MTSFPDPDCPCLPRPSRPCATDPDLRGQVRKDLGRRCYGRWSRNRHRLAGQGEDRASSGRARRLLPVPLRSSGRHGHTALFNDTDRNGLRDPPPGRTAAERGKHVELYDVKLRLDFRDAQGDFHLITDIGLPGPTGEWSFNVPGKPGLGHAVPQPRIDLRRTPISERKVRETGSQPRPDASARLPRIGSPHPL